MKRIAAMFLTIVPLTLSGATDPTYSVSDLCDAALIGNTESELGYRFRGDRCEGIYKLQVNSLAIRLDSLTESFEAFDPSGGQDLVIEWASYPSADSSGVRLQANSIVPETFYRMDSQASEKRRPFLWSPSFLESQDFTRADLGLLGWVEPEEPGGPQIFLPLRLHQQKPSVRSPTYEVALTPRNRLDQVLVTVGPISSPDARSSQLIWSAKPLELGPYLAAEPIFFDLPPLHTTGLYEVTIGATFSTGVSGNFRFVLYHEETSR